MMASLKHALLKHRTNCRPALKDNLPQIICQPGLMRINGLFRHGFLLAPALGNEVIHYLTEPDYQSSFNDLMQQVA